MRKKIASNTSNGLLCVVLLAGPVRAADYKIAPPEPQPNYWRQTFGPQAEVNAVAHGAFGQLLDRPEEWGTGIAGFGARIGSGFGAHLIHNTIQFPVARLLHEDLRYHRSTDTSFGPRLRHALLSSVWTRKTTTGKNTVAVGNISGAIGSGLISRLWQPAAAGSLASGFASGGISLGAHAGINVMREFWPRGEGSKKAPPRPKVDYSADPAPQ